MTDNKEFMIPSDFILVRFELLKDFYEMNDKFNFYLDHTKRGFKDKRGFDIWISSLRIFYLQIRSSIKKYIKGKEKSRYEKIVDLMENVVYHDRKLEDQEAREVTLLLGDYLDEIKLTDITQEKRDLGRIFGQL